MMIRQLSKLGFWPQSILGLKMINYNYQIPARKQNVPLQK